MKKQMTQAEISRRERRKKIRKRRLTISFFVLLLVAVIVFAVLLKTKLFPVKNITAKGSNIYSSEQIIKTSKITHSTPLFSINEKVLKKRFSKKLPYIETVEVKIKFPDTVSLQITDAKEYYAFKQGKEYYSVSQKGVVLNRYSELPENLVEVLSENTVLKIGESINFKDNQSKELFDFLATYPQEKGITVNSIDIKNKVRIVITVENKFKVNLGNKENLKEKIDHLAGMIPEIGDRKGEINLDMWSNSDSKGTFIAEN